MKNAKRKDFMVEIGRSMNRFLSILFIVALGVAFFAGIRSTRPDMELSADVYYDDTNLMDIRIVGTLGLTEDDVEAVRQLPETEHAEGAYTTDVLCESPDREQTVRIFSMSGQINQFTLLDGRMPERAGECLMDRGKAYKGQFGLGDTVKVCSGTDEELSDTLKCDTFTIVGIGMSSRYLSLERGTTTIGNGSLDTFMAVTPDNFSMDVFTDIYVQTKQGKSFLSYSDEYQDYIDLVTKEIEDTLSEPRSAIRYRDVTDEANRALNDARRELTEKTAETDRKLDDAARQIADAQKKIDEGKDDIKKGRADLEKGKTDLENAKNDLEDGKRTLAEKEQELADAKVTLAEKEQELEDGKVTLAEKEQELEDAKKEVTDKEKKLEDARKKFDEELPGARMELDDGWLEYEIGLEEYEDGKAELEEQQETLKEGWKEYRKNAPEVERNLKKALNGLIAMGVPLDITPSEISRIQVEEFEIDAYAPWLEMIPGGEGAMLVEGVHTLQASYQELTYGDAAVKEGKKELAKAKRELAKGKKKLDQGEMKLKNARRKLDEGEEQLADARQKIIDGEQKVEDAKQDIVDGEAKIADAHRDIADGEEKIADAHRDIADGEAKIPKAEKDIAKGEADIEEAQKKLNDGEADLEEAKGKYEDSRREAEEKIADAGKKIDDAQKEIDDIKEPEWYVLDRNSIQTYVEFGSDAERIGAIGKVFPFIFFLVAALVSLTTMTRMVEEQRLQIGTLKALGYGKWSIASKYIGYALAATLAGSILGAAAGEKLLPYVIMTAYFILYENLPVMLTPFNLHYALLASGLALACTVLATVFSSYRELLSSPAALMRPVPPKQGKRVLLEYVTPLWRRLTFIQKATVRNLFRYKKRCLMTIFGTGGCMALLLVGFGLNDSISTLGEKQYNDIWTYDVLVQTDDEADEAEQEKLRSFVSQGDVEAWLRVEETILDVSAGDVTKEAYLFVPENLDEVNRFVHLRSRESREPYVLDDDHVLITEKMAGLLDVKVGDTIFLKEDEGTHHPVVVGGIAENYLHHYVYMTPALYEKVYGEAPEYNTMFLNLKDLNEETQNRLGTELLSFDSVMAVTFIGTMRGQINDMLDSLNVVIWVLIISAGLLAFVVLYNLNNININERQRELATMKVLGFYNPELAAYVYRENIMLTILGSMVGIVMGYFLHRYVMTTVEVDMLMFGRQIRPVSYAYSVLMTYAFSAFVNLAMYDKLKGIDMVESLKSVE
ncbi:ABC transporter permease [Hungatella hathewayi]|uniref:ABC transporter permease n=1 Tax=Hungatella hathewayi TaxID=154046 RepID=UPI001DF89A57|nr:FtsX-like permease family protein [Hungatella hathewayi]MBS6755928.1 ABC transporter permease [Hungatella hathewayi]